MGKRISIFYKFSTRKCLRNLNLFLTEETGGRLNKKDRLTGYGDPHVKDKTSYRPSYL